MKKIFSIFAAMLVALAANAAVININTGTSDALRKALNNAASGDVIVMAEGTYVESNSDYIAFTGKNVTVMAEEGADVILVPKVPVRLKTGARAEFINIKFDCGHLSDLGSYSEIIVPADGTAGKKVILNGCEFYGWKQKSNAIIHTRSDRQLDSIVINNCNFHDNLYNCVSLKYASVDLVISNSTFANITTDASAPSLGVVDVQSTTGSVLIDHCTFYNCEVKNTDYGVIKIPTTIAPVVSNCIFMMPEEYAGGRAVYNAGGEVKNCLTYNYAKDEATGIHSGPTITGCIQADPMFRDAANGAYYLRAGSPAFGAGTDGSDIGDPRWIPTMDYYLVGNMTGWEIDPKYKLAKNPANEAEYMKAVLLYAGDDFKIAYSDGAAIEETNWFPGGVGNNFVVAASGEYTVYFRPDGQGGEGWHEGYIFAQAADLGPWTSWFGDADKQEEKNSFVAYDAASEKATVYIRTDKDGQWQAQVKYNGTPAEEGKCYRVALKMKANHDISGVTLKWQEENQTLSLAENMLFVYDEVVQGAVGEQGSNGILVLDFGFAKAGDVIEIFDVVIEETECPEPPTYYLIGSMSEWTIDEVYMFAANEAEAGEYMLDVQLAEGDQIKVVGISEGNESYYPGGIAAPYVVDAAHAGWVTIYFRPEGKAEWAAFGGYMYVDQHQAIELVETGVETTKAIENGQLIILKNGVKYNAQGTIVK